MSTKTGSSQIPQPSLHEPYGKASHKKGQLSRLGRKRDTFANVLIFVARVFLIVLLGSNTQLIVKVHMLGIRDKDALLLEARKRDTFLRWLSLWHLLREQMQRSRQ